jgi:hypothetical protein
MKMSRIYLILGILLVVVLFAAILFNLYTDVYLKNKYISGINNWIIKKEGFNYIEKNDINKVSTCIYKNLKDKYGNITDFPDRKNVSKKDFKIVLNCLKKDSLISESDYSKLINYDKIWKNKMFKELEKEFPDIDSTEIRRYVNCIYKKMKNKYKLIHLVPEPKNYSNEDWDIFKNCANEVLKNDKDSLAPKK